ncbi:Phosphopantothenoylcysteine decarboxylase / Phosphopantothenoylcysteine synthetase [plant metagenome]|uniref:Phosphopantothenoylcysteine decarboxylase / Phosphopantothenoylcysteine synthetase n=1 Tax=plant metagenome TaxID=1297885 RepID=A0A484SB80_9ZZZZ
MQDFAHKRIVLGLTGGVACYKSADLVRRLIEQGATVDVVMTEAATRFITPVTLQALSGRPVYTDAWDARVPNNMPHIALTRGADAILVAPASADFLSKLVHGAADDLLSTLCLARACPLLVAPAMNIEMWSNPATRRNVAQLREDGVTVLGPDAGDQACGETGEGRMLEPLALREELAAFFQPKLLAGKRVLLTAGPTAEPIDPVRVITNRSSGKTGYALARAAAEAGAHVTLVSGPTALAAPRGVRRVGVQTARQMHEAVLAVAPLADVFIAVAAVADWRVVNASTQKIKKQGGNESGLPTLSFEANPDILADVAALPDGPWCVGFAAETENLAEHAEAKRRRKGIDLLVGNLAQDVMDADTTALQLFDAQGVHLMPAADKLTAARRLVAEIAARLPPRGPLTA